MSINMNSYTPKVRLSAVQPSGDANGLSDQGVLDDITRGYADEIEHVAIVTFTAKEQHLRKSGTILSILEFTRIEVIKGETLASVREALAETAASRKATALPGLGVEGEQIGDRD